MNGDNRNVSIGGVNPFDGDRRNRLDVPRVPKRAEILEELIGDVRTRDDAFVVDPDDQIARPPMIRKVVRERADGFGELVGIGDRSRQLRSIGLVLGNDPSQFRLIHLERSLQRPVTNADPAPRVLGP